MNLSHIVIGPRITEKSHLDVSNNSYTFDVDPRANKHQIAQAIQNQFGVTVTNVRTIRGKSSLKRTGRRRLPKKIGPAKKAIVQLKKGDSINLFESPES